MPHRRPRLAVLFALLVLGACASPGGLDREPAPLSDAEKARVGKQVDRAVEAGKWTQAWNQAIEAGASRERLETIALDALVADDGVSEDMVEALRQKWGGLTSAGRGRVDAYVRELTDDLDDWSRAVEVEILTAEDAPTYAAAWRLYDRAPVRRAEAVLVAIVEARGAGNESD